MNMSVGEAFTKAMKTVARYVEKNMNPAKSQVFFRSYAPVHFKWVLRPCDHSTPPTLNVLKV